MAADLFAISVEPLAAEHIPSILAIEKQTNTAPWSDRSFLNEISNPLAVFLVAIKSGDLVGYGGVWLLVDEAHITTLSVDPAFQRQGIGRHLMNHLLARAQKRGMTCATLEVRASNTAAIALYESMGFIISARRKRYYPDNGEDALVMWLHELAE